MFVICSNQALVEEAIASGRKKPAMYCSIDASLGINPQKRAVMVIVVAETDWKCTEAFTDLLEACEGYYKKTIDQPFTGYACYRSLEDFVLGPDLQSANLVLIADERLFDIANNPELERILPFL